MSRPTDRRSRWLPVFVVAVFALVLAVDAVVLLFHDDYRRIVDGDPVEAVFTPAGRAGRDAAPIAVVLKPGESARTGDGAVLVRATDAGLEISAPGELLIRFRVDHAGGFVELDYAFGGPREDARCGIFLSRVPSRYGVDLVGRRTVTARKGRMGRFRHSLTDHVGWFELVVEVGEAAADGGLTVGLPEVVWD